MKTKIAILTLCILVLLCACGKKQQPLPETTAALPTEVQTEPEATAPEIRDTAFYSGTWEVTGVRVNGTVFSLEQAVALGANQLEGIYMILSEDNTCYLGTQQGSNTGKWQVTEDGIQIDTLEISFADSCLELNYNGNILLFEKTSDLQEPPVSPEETEAPSTEAPTEAAGFRPEFKAAMDSYEAFYDDFCAIMEEYTNNPADLSLLGKYTDMLTKMEKMDREFRAWDQSEMSSEELKYYLDVNTRIQKKIIDLF